MVAIFRMSPNTHIWNERWNRSITKYQIYLLTQNDAIRCVALASAQFNEGFFFFIVFNVCNVLSYVTLKIPNDNNNNIIIKTEKK